MQIRRCIVILAGLGIVSSTMAAPPILASPIDSALPPAAVVQRADGEFVGGMAVDPDSGTAVVTGELEVPGRLVSDLGVIAYAADGSQLWRQQFGPGDTGKVAIDSVLDIVYVVATSYTDLGTDDDILVAAFALADGEPLWQRRCGCIHSVGLRIEVDPARGRVYAAGILLQAGAAQTAVTLAYAADGTALWTATYAESGRSTWPGDVAVDPADGAVYVPVAVAGGLGFRLVSYSRDGAKRWAESVVSAGTRQFARGVTLQVEVDSLRQTVYVAGLGRDRSRSEGIVTAGYSTSGAQRWLQQLDPQGQPTTVVGLVVDPRTGRVFVAASAHGYAIAAYTRDGELLWSARPNPGGSIPVRATDLAIDSGRGVLFVTGQGSQRQPNGDQIYLTMSYTLNGRPLAPLVFNGQPPGGRGFDYAVAVDVDPVRHVLWVTGETTGDDDFDREWATIAYRT